MINIVPSVVRVEKKCVQKPSIDLTKKVRIGQVSYMFCNTFKGRLLNNCSISGLD
jgi:hypothetical protein